MSVAKPGCQRSAQLNPTPRGAMLRNNVVRGRDVAMRKLLARIQAKAVK